MRLLSFIIGATLGALAPLQADTAPVPTGWDRISVAPTKSSIYVGSVTLTLGEFERQGSALTASYAARVFPWFFWSETGRITIELSDADLTRVARGDTVEFNGDGINQKHKSRKITGRAQPVDAISGKFKVRVLADGVELIFNSTYHLVSR
jgi:hypothetical protein